MYSRKKTFEELPQEETAIWQCTNDGCNGWMRDNFAFESIPTCVLCHSPMESGTRMLPQLTNMSNSKSSKMGVRI
ncbi:cold-shock protein [Cohnella fermenti]|uniref:Cold-shock protein n=1 Tax=Cohnella fermenti TaxID=2565925 RepID=A0A4S4C9C5_9BACL|nr:cold-shock protein [Cohnella fermenti]THF84660.1 cold-shock protein [Cohnella fermenti]